MDTPGILKKEYIIGLDIGSSAIKMAQFMQRPDKPCLVKAGLQEYRYSEDINALEKELVLGIKTLLKGVEFSKSKFIVSFDSPKSESKKIVVPYMPSGELKDAINLQAKNYLHYPPQESILDFEILQDLVDKGTRKYEVLITACPKDTIEQYLSMLKKAGITPASLIPVSYALQKVAESCYAKEGLRCFIDIGQVYTELIILRGKRLMFSRRIPISGLDFTKAMTGVLLSDIGKTELSLAEAEKIKQEEGIPDAGESRIIANKISSSQLLSMLRTPAEQLANEIDRCFDFFREEAGSEKITSVVLFGGGASLKGLTKFLSDGLGIEVTLGDALWGLNIAQGAVNNRESISHRLDIAIGAATSQGKGINLLPLEVKEQTKRMVKRSGIEAVTTALILVSVLVFIGMKIQLNNIQKRISVARLELSSLQPQLKKAQARSLANMVLADEPQWEDIFIELSNVIPDDIHIENIKMENSIITIKGVVGSEDGEEVFSDFLFKLENGIFNNVKLIESKELHGKPGDEFELKCWIDYEK